MTFLYDYFLEYTTLKILVGVGVFGFAAGQVGVFAFLRSESLLGDAISHAALPGIALVFLCTHSKNPLLLLGGGVLAGLIGVCFLYAAEKHTALKKDAILGIILSVFFGIGLVLLTVIQKLPVSNQSILNKFLFGNAALLLWQDIYVITAISVGVLCILHTYKRIFSATTFDQQFIRSLGFSVHYLHILLLSLLVITIVIGLQAVGVVLMSSMLVAPAAAARQWVTSINNMLLVAGLLGLFSSVAGTLLSGMYLNMPTGPAIVVVASVLVLFSLLCAPRRGLLRSCR